jgi:hypothetical protein
VGRSSRGFLWTAGGLLLLGGAAAVLASWPVPAPPLPPPDAWARAAAPRDLRASPGGEPLAGYRVLALGADPARVGPGKPQPFVVLGPGAGGEGTWSLYATGATADAGGERWWLFSRTRGR